MEELQASSIEQLTTEILIYKQQTAQNIIEIGKRLIAVKEQLPHGEWGKWLEEKVDFTHQTANKFMKVAEEMSNYASMRNIGTAKIFALLSLPQEKRQDFIESHPVDEMTTRELQQAIKENKQLKEQVEELQNAKPIIKEVEKTVYPSDYQTIKGRLQLLESSIQESETKIKRLLEDKQLLERKVKLNEQEASEYNNLKVRIEKLKQDKNSLSRQIEAATELSGLVVNIENMLKKELAPVKYSRAINEQGHDEVVVKNLKEIIGRVQQWCDEMTELLPNKNYIDAKVVDVNE